MIGKGDFMLEIAIVEDEEKEALRLGGFLDRFSEETGIQLNHRWSDNASVFLEQYQFQYDLIFMDIRMPGIDGMAAAERLREIDSAVKLIFSFRCLFSAKAACLYTISIAVI